MSHAKPVALTLLGELQLARRGRKFLGGERIELLEAIDRAGSISQAAKRVHLSYKAAWDAVEAMNNLAQQPLLIRTTGGEHGGGSRLTAYGREIVQLYRLLESGQRRLLSRMQTKVHDFDALNQLLKAIAMKTSARNQYRGQVKSVRKGAVNADVMLDLGDGLEIFANITNEAVEDLDLHPGREAVALIKASFVLLSPDLNVRISARNRLAGVVSAVIPGAVNCEIKVQLAGARTLTAIVTQEGWKELDLAEGSPCLALIKASHVLLAVTD
jgi:molybdate transport system regulatory protein